MFQLSAAFGSSSVPFHNSSRQLTNTPRSSRISIEWLDVRKVGVWLNLEGLRPIRPVADKSNGLDGHGAQHNGNEQNGNEQNGSEQDSDEQDGRTE